MVHSQIVSFIWGVADLIRDTFKRGKNQDVILLTCPPETNPVRALGFSVRLGFEKEVSSGKEALHYRADHCEGCGLEATEHRRLTVNAWGRLQTPEI